MNRRADAPLVGRRPGSSGHTGSVRIYLPATFADLDARPAPLDVGAAHGVTALVRSALPDEDEEAWEFVAQLAAADDSLARMADDDVPLRLVISAEVPDVGVRGVDGAAEPSQVLLSAPVAWREVVCVLVDEPAAAADVRAARSGDSEAAARLAERDLLWYDVGELADIPRPEEPSA